MNRLRSHGNDLLHATKNFISAADKKRMKHLFYFFALSFIYTHAGHAAEKLCTCKCVVKDGDEAYATISGEGKDREAAGLDLKKNLKKLKCELTPTCEGICSLDDSKK